VRQYAAFPGEDYSAKIKVVGVGGGGGNAISRMRSDIAIKGIDFIAINTDAQDLDYANAKTRIYIGKNLTRGLGTGMNPDLGRQAAEENRSEISEALKGADLVFITAVATMDEVYFLVREVHGPISIAAGMAYNIRTMSVKALKDAGVARVSIPAIAILSSIRAMTDALRSVRDTEDFAEVLGNNRICGMEDIAALLKRT